MLILLFWNDTSDIIAVCNTQQYTHISINGPRTGGYFKNVNIIRDHNTIQNQRKLIDLVMRIELTREILSSRISDFLRNSTIDFCMFSHFVTCFLRVTVSLLCWSHAVSKIHIPIYPILIVIGTKLLELVTGTTTKPRLSGNMLPNIKRCKDLLANFSENLRVVVIKLFELTQIASPNPSIYFSFARCWGKVGVRCDVCIFKLTARAQSINRGLCTTVYCKHQ